MTEISELTAALATTSTDIAAALDRVKIAFSAMGVNEKAATLVALDRIKKCVLKLICRRQRTIPSVAGLEGSLASLPSRAKPSSELAKKKKQPATPEPPKPSGG